MRSEPPLCTAFTAQRIQTTLKKTVRHMKESGNKPPGIEVGNAWAVRCPDISDTNWIVGVFPTIPKDSLRFMEQTDTAKEQIGTMAADIGIKWFVHRTDDPSDWGDSKPTSNGRTMSILASDGEFELTFTTEGHEYTLTLDAPGDFAIWGPGLDHSWKPLKTSPVITIRWKPE